MTYVEAPPDSQVHHKHLQRGQIAILTDAIGPTYMIEFCSRLDTDAFTVVVGTVLMPDLEKWIRGSRDTMVTRPVRIP